MTDREIAERIVSLPLWSTLFKEEARALTTEIERAIAAARTDGARQMRERAATFVEKTGRSIVAKAVRALPLESTE